ncbi:uncharacterized protein Dwil_GK14574 [Drosophila willistoni]|uniref:Uncharacterized protein n=1 Tax=Drosophila willistoni TaxID=7260 RepID=B4MWW5_DROWI|nr:uncharacterized protein LOC6642118 [Drosophila willistoni]EDW76604.1 uncharacterized protein Dwil_GK14574 [Drosophila willistoni]
MFVGDAIFNAVLVAACLYTMYELTPADHPYGYTAAAFSLVHGLFGIVHSLQEPPEDEECELTSRAIMISTSIIETIVLALANIEFYLKSDQSAVALVHGLAVIPLFYDMLGKMSDDLDSNTETLKSLAVFGNILSTSHLAYKEGNAIYAGVAAAAFIARYCASYIDGFFQGMGAHVNTLGNATILALMTYALTQK